MLKSNDPMPWGKHKGTHMIMVPATYYMYLLEKNIHGPVRTYIDQNIDSIRQNYNDYQAMKAIKPRRL
jgi:hypothetical protein